MKTIFANVMTRGGKRRRAAALQDAGALTLASAIREASWTVPVLWRFCLALGLSLFVFNQTGFGADAAADFAATWLFLRELEVFFAVLFAIFAFSTSNCQRRHNFATDHDDFQQTSDASTLESHLIMSAGRR